MNCTLDTKQQWALIAKIAVDIDDLKSFDFDSYARDFYNKILAKTNDAVLAANYVGMLPMNIRAMSGSKTLFAKISAVAPRIAELEAKFEDFKNVEEYITGLATSQKDVATLQNAMQKESLTAPKEQKDPEPKDITAKKQLSLFDITTFDVDQHAFLKPELKPYADAKSLLIKNFKEDGTSLIGDTPVKIMLVSAHDFEAGDFYPDTQRFIASDPEGLKKSQDGIVMLITDLQGNKVYFNNSMQKSEKAGGKLIFYNIRAPKTDRAPLDDNDKALASILVKDRGVSAKDAETIIRKNLRAVFYMREYIKKDPANNKLNLNITGGTAKISAKKSKIFYPVSSVDFGGESFIPYMGVPANKQNPNQTFFNYPGTAFPVNVNREALPQDLRTKLVKLLTEDVYRDVGGKKIPVSVSDKLKIFRQFIYVSPDIFDMQVREGKLVVFMDAEVKDFPTKEAFAEALEEFLTKPMKQREVTPAYAKEQLAKGYYRVTPANRALAKPGQILEQVKSDGTLGYWVMGPIQMSVMKNLISSKYLDFEIGEGSTITTSKKDYNEFVKNNFSVGFEKPQPAGSTLNIELDPADFVKLTKQDSPKVPETKPEPITIKEPLKGFTPEEHLIELRRRDPKRYDKLIGQQGLKATLEQIAEAKKWYDSHPMSAHVPYEQAFNMINQENSNSIATWAVSGITLYKESDYSDLYHEAWHGFTQGFLTPDQTIKLYGEMRSKSGSFVDFNGQMVKFTEADEKQLEEFLAEDFREYMLSGGTKVFRESPVKNNIFKKILNFLKLLFGTATVTSINDGKVNATVTALYNKLRIGDIGEYTFDAENRNFDTLNKALIPTTLEDSWNSENSNLIFRTVESLFSEGVDAMNAQNMKDIDELRALNAKTDKTKGDLEKIHDLELTVTSGYTTRMLASPTGVKDLYTYAKLKIAKRLADLEAEGKDQKNIDLLEAALRNFGDIENLDKNKEGVGVIGYHMFKSALIQQEYFDALDEEAEDEEFNKREEKGRDQYSDNSDKSIFDLARREITNLIRGLKQYDSQGNVINNQLGFAELANFKQTFAYIARVCENSEDITQMYDSLKAEAEKYKPIKQVLSKLGPLSYLNQSERERTLWRKFFQTFNKYRHVLSQTTITESYETDQEGRKVEGAPSTFDLSIGNAMTDLNKVHRDWQSDFSKTNKNPYIKNDKGGNYLDVKALLKDYPTLQSADADPINFLKSVGIVFSDIPIIKEVLDANIKSGYIRLSGIYSNLENLAVRGTIVRAMNTFLKNNPALGVKGQTGPRSNYGKLQALQSRYSGEYSDFMVKNAAGDPYSEYTRQSTASQTALLWNNSSSYNSLVNTPRGAHYNNTKDAQGKPYNPWVKASIWVDSFFNMTTPGGPHTGNEMVIENLSGINTSVNGAFIGDGTDLISSDAVSKLLHDLHIQLMRFTPELTRHAGKSKSLSMFLRRYNTGADEKRLYIDTDNFVPDAGGFNKGLSEYFNILKKYISAEHDRIQYAKELLASGIEEADFKYLERAQDFHAFAGVLSKETQGILKGIQGDLLAHINSPEGADLSSRLYGEVSTYFNNLVTGVKTKVDEYNFLAPSLVEKVEKAVKANDKVPETSAVRNAIVSSFVANNWIHHFEEMINLYGDIALYKNDFFKRNAGLASDGDIALYKNDFFKRNAGLASDGDIMDNSATFIQDMNSNIKRPWAETLGIPYQPYDGTITAAVVADNEVASVYLNKYREASKDKGLIEDKYGNVNEADSEGAVQFDSYRMILKSLAKWTDSQEKAFQDIMSGKSIDSIEVTEFFPVLKMGYYGPLKVTNGLPIMGMHKFSLFPLIPGVIPQNLITLHEKMMREGIDYLTFASGSKVGTITGPKGLQPLYKSINKRELNDAPFVRNTVFPEYFKYQIEVANKFKGKFTLPTQLRKLALIGMNDQGVPIDYKGDDWDSLNETQKLKASENYRIQQRYLRSLENLQEYHKQKLLADIGWKKDKNGKPQGNMKSLLKLVTDELQRKDVGDHEWMYIQTLKDGDIKNSLDISMSAEIIDKVVTAMANKRLINIKVKGENLVLVANTGWENMDFAYSEKRKFKKPTDAELKKYGTNDLPFYQLGKDKISAAKCKIALQGDFKKLLTLPDVIERSKTNRISRRQALNQLLKDDVWLDKNDIRDMITLVGARIPTQGPNSSEFLEVYEFLPELAGNIIILPSEITAKSGTDFDYDKLPSMMPHLQMREGNVVLNKKYTKAEAKALHEKIVNKVWKTDTAVDKLLKDIFGEDAALTEEELNEELIKAGEKPFDEFFEQLNSGVGHLENDVMFSLKAMMERPDNFEALITPNDTGKTKPYATAIRGDQRTDGSQIFEPLRNLEVQQANSVGQGTIGIGAKSNTFNTIAESIGLTLKPTFMPYKKQPRRATLLFKHNKAVDGGISVSKRMDALDENNISEIISQLINGWVDVEKDDWISYIQGNKEIAPIMLFMLRAGVPIQDVVYFVGQPLIREYVKEQRIARSSFSQVLGYGKPFSAKMTARKIILEKYMPSIPVTHKDMYAEAVHRTAGFSEFDLQKMKEALGSYTHEEGRYDPDEFDKAAFLHFYEIEKMVDEFDKVQQAFNFDTTKSQSLSEFYAKIKEVEDLKNNTLIDQKYIKAFIEKSPIGPFYVNQFVLDVFAKLMPLRNHPVLNDFINSLSNDQIAKLFDLNSQDGREAFQTMFKNDLISYIFQNKTRKYIKDPSVKITDQPQAAEILPNTFTFPEERDNFLQEREKLRALYPFEAINGSIEFGEYMKSNEAREDLKLADESVEDYVQRLEKISYEEILRDKALYNILNPWVLFRSRNNVANTWAHIMDQYPQLKGHFSVLNNMKVTSELNVHNLMPSTLKYSSDEIDIFYENLQDLGNSTKLLGIKDINKKDAEYIADFFSKLPLYLYMQAGPTLRNPFSFARFSPYDSVRRILEKPVKDLTEKLDFDYLETFLSQWIKANVDTKTRNRYKDFMQLSLFEPAVQEIESGEREYTPENIEVLKPNEVFVFGSNTEGRHGKGAALVAKQRFGAIQGESYGPQGQSYAIVTKNLNKGERSVPLNHIQENINEFLEYAATYKDKKFYVTKIGSSLAGYTVGEIRQLFQNIHDMFEGGGGIPENVVLPEEYEVRDRVQPMKDPTAKTIVFKAYSGIQVQPSEPVQTISDEELNDEMNNCPTK